MSCTVYVNGNERQLHWSVGFLNYDRVVKLSGLPYRTDYSVAYHDPADSNPNHYRDLGGGVCPLPGMVFEVSVTYRKPWWRYLWPE